MFVFVFVPIVSSNLFGFDRTALHSVRLEITGVLSAELSDQNSKQRTQSALDFGDLQVSVSVAPATFKQDRADIVKLADTAWLVVWQDQRFGSSKILGQIINQTGSLVGENFLLAGSDNGADLVEPILLVDTLNRVYLFYRDQSNGLIYGRRYLSDLTIDIPTFLINDTSAVSFAGPMAAAVYPEGRFVVVWESYTIIGSTIQTRLYSSTGSSLAGPTSVNTDGGFSQHWVPSVAVRPSGGFLVVWEDYRNGQADIYGALFDGNGSAVGGDFGLVPTPANLADQYAPRVVYSSIHQYMIGWLDRRDGQELFIQKYDRLIGLVGSNRQISGPDLAVINWDVNLAVDPNGELLIGWAAYSAVNQIAALRLDANLDPVGSEAVINQSTSNQRWSPKAAYLSADNLAFAWTDLADGEPDISLARFDGNLVRLGSELTLNDDAVGAVSTDPVIAGSDWYHLVAWTDRRNDYGDIYLRGINPAGGFLSMPRRVNQDEFGNLQGEPSIAAAGSTSMVAWVDGRAVTGLSGQRIYARRFNESGMNGSSEIQISDALQIAPKSEPSVALNPDGSGLIAWVDKRNGSAQLFGQWIDTEGDLIGSDFMISDDLNDVQNGYVSLDLDNAGRVFIVWLDYGQSEPTVRGEFFHADRSYGGSFLWTSDVSGVAIDQLSAAVTPAGETFLAWTGADDTYTHIYLTVLDSTGSLISPSEEITDESNMTASDPSVSIDENGYLVAGWLDGRSGRRLGYYQLFDDILAPIGGNTAFSSATPEYMEAPTVLAHRGRAWFTWADPRIEGLNVFIGSYVYLPTDVDDSDDDLIPAIYHLSQNYPNPFNPSTTITFSLPRSTQARLVVYNLLGQEVIKLADSRFVAGEHTVVWDGKNQAGDRVTSGVYFYRLTTEQFSEQKKMVLIK